MTDQPTTSRAKRWLVRLGLLLVMVQHAVVIGPRAVRSDCPIRGVDAATYVLLSVPLSEGKGYVEPYTPGHPPYTIAPPLLPACLALIRMAGGGVAAFYAFVLACSLLGLVLIWIYLSPLIGEAWALAVTAATALTPVYIQYSGRIFAEMPFIVLLFGTLLVLRAAAKVPSRRLAIASAPMVGAVTMIKSVGLALLPAAVFHLLHSAPVGAARWRRGLLVMVIAMIPLALWFARNRYHGVAGGTTYVRIASLRDENDYDQGTAGAVDMLQRFRENASFYSEQMVALCTIDPSARVPRPWSTIFSGVIALVIILGAVLQARTRRDPGAAFLATSMLILLIYVAHSLRYLIPVFPLVLAYFLTGAKALTSDRIGSESGRRAAGIVLAIAILVVWFVPRARHHGWAVATYLEESPQSLASQEEGRRMTEWLEEHSKKDDVVLCWLAPVTALATGHECVEYERTRDTHSLDRVLGRYQVRWIMLGHPTEIEKAIEAHLLSDPAHFSCVWAGDSMRLYSVAGR